MSRETFPLDTFDVTASDIAEADVNALVALSVGVGWSHRAKDWDFLRSIGRGWVAMDEARRVHGSAMWFPLGDDFATIGMVITTPRLQSNGGAHWLVSRILEEAKERKIGLHATQQSHKLFLSLGFRDEGLVYQFEGRIDSPANFESRSNGKIRQLGASDLPAILDLDMSATGRDRQALVKALATQSSGTVLVTDGQLTACALARPFGRGLMIGPVIAPCEDDAHDVLCSLLAEHQGRYVRVDSLRDDGLIARCAQACGLLMTETVMRMSLGQRWRFSQPGRNVLFAPASQATG